MLPCTRTTAARCPVLVLVLAAGLGGLGAGCTIRTSGNLFGSSSASAGPSEVTGSAPANESGANSATSDGGEAKGPKTDDPKISAWAAECRKDYEDFRAKWGPIEAKRRKEVETLAKADYYTGSEGLKKLWQKTLEEDAKPAGLFVGATGKLTMTTGVAFEAARAYADLQKRTGRDFLPPPIYGDFAAGPVFTGEDREAEADYYCSVACSRGGHRAPPLHDDDVSARFDFAEWLTPVRQKRLSAFKNKHGEIAKAGLTRKVPRVGTLGQKDGELGKADGVIKTIKTAAGKTVMVVDEMYDDEVCQETNKVDRIDDNGRLVYRQRCTSRGMKVSLRMTVTFSDLPPEPIKIGDAIEVFGVAGPRKGDALPVEGRHIGSIERKGQKIADY